jgi:hypothetical protein
MVVATLPPLYAHGLGREPGPERGVVDRPRRDAEAIQPQTVDKGRVQQEMLDADAADTSKRRPSRERGRRIVRPRDQPRRHSVPHGLLARDRMKRENLQMAAARPRARYPAHRVAARAVALGVDAVTTETPRRCTRACFKMAQLA